jgi:hypothetical protein
MMPATQAAPAPSRAGRAAASRKRDTERELRVLVFAPQVPWPPQQGAAIRNFYVLRALAKRHKVVLAAFGDPDAEPGPLQAAGIEVIAVPPPKPRVKLRRALDLILTLSPDLARRLDSETMRATARVRAVLEEPFDVIHVEGLAMPTMRSGSSSAAPSRPT